MKRGKTDQKDGSIKMVCPFCGSKPRIKESPTGVKYGCSFEGCWMFGLFISSVIWNTRYKNESGKLDILIEKRVLEAQANEIMQSFKNKGFAKLFGFGGIKQ